jgi:FlaA1/EpsC-like NDP-sugar epimerase
MNKKISRVFFLIMLDALAINASYLVVLFLRFELDYKDATFNQFLLIYAANFAVITLIKIAVFYVFDLYNSLWKYASTTELIKIVSAAVFASAAVTTFLVISGNMLPRSVLIIACLFDMFFIGGIRFSYRAFRGIYKRTLPLILTKTGKEAIRPDFISKVENKKIMIVGAGDAGSVIIKEIQLSEDRGQSVVVVVDDDPQKLRRKIHGVNIAGMVKDISHLVEKHRIDEIIIAVPSADRSEIQRIIQECSKTKCKVKILPGMADLINGKVSVTKLRDVNILDLLGRDAVDLDIEGVSEYLNDKVVLVTGGGGSIGSELCRQIAKFNPSLLIALDIYENSVFTLDNEMKLLYPDLNFEVAIASVRNPSRIRDVFNKYKPQVIFHAAAHKHVPLMENNPKEAVLNNLLGTKTVADIAEECGVERFVLISTDKAVNPTNVMGATKRAAEFIIQDKASRCDCLKEKNEAQKTIFSAVRFGNVLDSNGSVIPTFKKQIEMGGPVTVTHPDITRYFMTIPEAAQLVIQTGAMAFGGEIFILDMGQPVRIMDLAENMIELSGYKPYVDIDIKITGLRPGEKLYEELLMAEEGIKQTRHSKIFIGQPTPMNKAMEELLEPDGLGLEKLKQNLVDVEDEEVKKWLAQIIPTYNRNQ